MLNFNLTTYNHHLGDQAINRTLLDPLIKMLNEEDIVIERKCAPQLRKSIERILQVLGWTGQVKIDKTKGITITSMKENIGLCLQTGNMGRFYADMLKLQTLYVNGKIDAGIYIIPSKQAAVIMGDNIANFDRFIKELELYKKIITIPIHVIGIDI